MKKIVTSFIAAVLLLTVILSGGNYTYAAEGSNIASVDAINQKINDIKENNQKLQKIRQDIGGRTDTIYQKLKSIKSQKAKLTNLQISEIKAMLKNMTKVTRAVNSDNKKISQLGNKINQYISDNKTSDAAALADKLLIIQNTKVTRMNQILDMLKKADTMLQGEITTTSAISLN